MRRLCYVCRKVNYENPHLTFHRFPSSLKKRTKWMSILNIQVPKNCFICSNHFDSSDFMISIDNVHYLKPTAVPKSFRPAQTAVEHIEGGSFDSPPNEVLVYEQESLIENLVEIIKIEETDLSNIKCELSEDNLVHSETGKTLPVVNTKLSVHTPFKPVFAESDSLCDGSIRNSASESKSILENQNINHISEFVDGTPISIINCSSLIRPAQKQLQQRETKLITHHTLSTPVSAENDQLSDVPNTENALESENLISNILENENIKNIISEFEGGIPVSFIGRFSLTGKQLSKSETEEIPRVVRIPAVNRKLNAHTSLEPVLNEVDPQSVFEFNGPILNTLEFENLTDTAVFNDDIPVSLMAGTQLRKGGTEETSLTRTSAVNTKLNTYTPFTSVSAEAVTLSDVSDTDTAVETEGLILNLLKNENINNISELKEMSYTSLVRKARKPFRKGGTTETSTSAPQPVVNRALNASTSSAVQNGSISDDSSTDTAPETEDQITNILENETVNNTSEFDDDLLSAFRGRLSLIREDRKQKRKRKIGNLKNLDSSDFFASDEAKKKFKEMQTTLNTQKSKIRILQQSLRRLRNKVSKLKNGIKMIKKMGSIYLTSGIS